MKKKLFFVFLFIGINFSGIILINSLVVGAGHSCRCYPDQSDINALCYQKCGWGNCDGCDPFYPEGICDQFNVPPYKCSWIFVCYCIEPEGEWSSGVVDAYWCEVDCSII